MKLAGLRGRSIKGNVIFDPQSPANRDNCFGPYIALRDRFLQHGVELNTSDISGTRSEFELHQDVQISPRIACKYLMLFETPLVKPENGDSSHWQAYRKIFTWRDDLVDGKKFIKMNFPNPIVIPEVTGWAARDIFCSLISANKSLSVRDERDLYKERVKVIRWFESNAPEYFQLYGIDWDIPVMPTGIIGKLGRKVYKMFSRLNRSHPFPSYHGRVNNKRDVLLRSRFAICYENVRGYDGYITEKIFDCFFSGCIPIYWGAGNINRYIPDDCFIDRRRFSDTAAVFDYLNTISERQFTDFQQRIAAYLSSAAARPFGADFFAETIVKTIVQDLGE